MTQHFQLTGGWVEVIAGSMFSGKSEELIRRVRPAYINTRSVAFKVTRKFAAPAAIRAALEFEAELLAYDAGAGFITRREAARRGATLRARARE